MILQIFRKWLFTRKAKKDGIFDCALIFIVSLHYGVVNIGKENKAQCELSSN